MTPVWPCLPTPTGLSKPGEPGQTSWCRQLALLFKCSVSEDCVKTEVKNGKKKQCLNTERKVSGTILAPPYENGRTLFFS